MQTVICYKHSITLFPHLEPCKFFFLSTHKNRKLLEFPSDRHHYTSKTRILCSATSPPPVSYGGWDDLQGNSGNHPASNQIQEFLNFLGIGDKKYAFVYLFGFVCALAVSRVKVSSIIVFPACAIVFAFGFSIGLVKGGPLTELKLNEDRRRASDEGLGVIIEKLRGLMDNLNGQNSRVNTLKTGIRRNIDSNEVTVSDLESYMKLSESLYAYSSNAIKVVDGCARDLLAGRQEKAIDLGHEATRIKNKGIDFSGFFGGKIDSERSSKVKVLGKKELVDNEANDRKNILVDSIKQASFDSSMNKRFEYNEANTSTGFFDDEDDGTQVNSEVLNDRIRMNDICAEAKTRNLYEKIDAAEEVSEESSYAYGSRSSRFVNNQHVHMKDYKDDFEKAEYHNSSYDSVDFSISMKHRKSSASFSSKPKEEIFDQSYLHSHLADDQIDSQRTNFEKEMFDPRKKAFSADNDDAHENFPPSSEIGDDLKFDNYVGEAYQLLRQAKQLFKNRVDDSAEHALNKSAVLLTKAIDMRPMSLLAVGQLGNTYLLHGELKLRMSRELRSLLSRTDPMSVDDYEFLHASYNKLANKEKITSTLVNVCEECEELLIKAGRTYRVALSVDGNDLKSLYNWGLALGFRAQLIADIGPNAARDADKVFLAAIDKFDAILSKSNTHAPDALFRWGDALHQRSRLRPRNSKEKVKLLQQARRLYEDALHMDSGNRLVQEALVSCVSELRLLL